MALPLPLSEATECLNYINLQIDGFTAGFGRVFPLDLQHLVAEWIINDPDLLLVLSARRNCVCPTKVHISSGNNCVLLHCTTVTRELALAAFCKLGGEALEFILPEDITYDMCLRAVQDSFHYIRWVPVIHRTFELCRIMCEKAPTILDGFLELDEPSQQLWEWALPKQPEVMRLMRAEPAPRFLLFYLTLNPMHLVYVPSHLSTESLQSVAVQSDGMALQFVSRHSSGVGWLAVKNNPEAFKFVRYQSRDTCFEAIQGRPNNILLVKNPTDEMLALAVHLEPSLYASLPAKYQTPALAAVVDSRNHKLALALKIV